MIPLLVFLLFPLAELAVMIQVGSWVGVWPTILAVVLTGVLGVALVRSQGLAVLRQASAAAERGEAPVGAVFHGFCIVFAGILLIVPGFITDTVGLLLFAPFVRGALGRWLLDRVRRQETMRVWVDGRPVHPGRAEPRRPPARPGVIDVEYEEVRDEPSDRPADAPDPPPLGASRWGRHDRRDDDDDRRS